MLQHAPPISIATKNQEATIETTEMRFLRSVAGYTRKGQTRNNEILKFKSK
jgi:hypothetical protein